MKIYAFVFLLAAVVLVECGNTFMGTNVFRNVVFHKDVKFESKFIQKRVEYLNYTMPTSYYGRRIQGILAYDMTYSGASANVTQGGLGFTYVTLRMKSDRGKEMHYDVWIYA